jgi:hypothetical protein
LDKFRIIAGIARSVLVRIQEETEIRTQMPGRFLSKG